MRRLSATFPLAPLWGSDVAKLRPTRKGNMGRDRKPPHPRRDAGAWEDAWHEHAEGSRRNGIIPTNHTLRATSTHKTEQYPG